jgi:hypothetical protein
LLLIFPYPTTAPPNRFPDSNSYRNLLRHRQSSLRSRSLEALEDADPMSALSITSVPFGVRRVYQFTSLAPATGCLLLAEWPLSAARFSDTYMNGSLTRTP